MGLNRQKDHSKSSWRERRTKAMDALVAVSTISTSISTRATIMHSAVKYQQAIQQLDKLSSRSKLISSTSFEDNFNQLSDLGCTQLFRFCRRDVDNLVPIIAWPLDKRRTTMNGYRVTELLATCGIQRIATADRWCDLEPLFGKFPPQLAEIFRDALHHFMTARGHLLSSNIPAFYVAERAEDYSSAVLKRTDCMDNRIAFIDGTVIGIARPGGDDMHQRVTYNGHKRKHALKFQGVTTPDGPCIHLHGPEVGRRHDMFLYASSEMDDQLRDTTVVDGKQYAVYGDSGYSWRVYLEVPFSGSNLSNTEKAFRKSMSAARITVEWYFKCVKQLWSFVDSKRKLRVLEMPAGMIYRAAVLLTNIHNCVQPNQISQYFDCTPPSLEEYILSRTNQ